MSLETPDRIRASAVLLFQNFFTPGEETVELRGTAGFASVAFLDAVIDPTLGVVLQMENPVTPDEGAIYAQGDAFANVIEGGFITPLATSSEPLIEALPDNSVVVQDIEGEVPNFRVYVTVFRMAFAGQPVAQIPGP